MALEHMQNNKKHKRGRWILPIKLSAFDEGEEKRRAMLEEEKKNYVKHNRGEKRGKSVRLRVRTMLG